MQISGRGRLVGDITARPDDVRIRIDDARDEAFWCEIRLTRGELLALVSLSDEQQAIEDGVAGCVAPF